MAARSALPVPYTPDSQPSLPSGDQRFLQLQLQQIATSLTSLIRLAPQPATSVPKSPVDGMVRLSRSPWRPIVGVVTDAWVFWDGPSSTWKLLHLN